MDFLNLFITALMPVLKVLIITAIGAFLATKRINLLGDDARKHFNHVVFYCFLPAFIASILTESITAKSVITLWFMPVSVLFTYIIGSVLGWFLIKITKDPFNLKGLVLGCCAAGNLGNMPVIIVPAVCNQRSRPFGPLEACQRHGMAYASLLLALGNIYTWSYVNNLVRISCHRSDVDQINNSSQNPESATGTDPENPSNIAIGPLDTADNTSQANDNVKKQGNIMKPLKTIARKLHLKVLLAPATLASIVGLVLGVVPQFRKLLVGDSAPLRVIQENASLLGEASIPTMTLFVGGNLVKGLKGSGMKLSIILGIAAIRFIILPVLGVGVLKGAAHFGWINHDPLYQFILLFQHALPPAISISTITQLFGAGEIECSVVMLATNAIAAVSLTLWSAFYMWLVL